MGVQQVGRRLAAILAADVVGYSRLMGANEVGTLAALKAHRNELVDGRIAEHQGRIVKLTGDGMLVEFPSVVNAVECATKIQCEMRLRNADVPEDRRIEFRIGINRAKEWMARALAIDPDDNIGRYNAACTYSLLGEIDRSIDLLEICLPQFGSDMKLWFR